MSDPVSRSNLGLLLLAGIGAGALTGTLFGLLALRRPRSATRDEISESVDDLKRRAEQILRELSQADPAVPDAPAMNR